MTLTNVWRKQTSAAIRDMISLWNDWLPMEHVDNFGRGETRGLCRGERVSGEGKGGSGVKCGAAYIITAKSISKKNIKYSVAKTSPIPYVATFLLSFRVLKYELVVIF